MTAPHVPFGTQPDPRQLMNNAPKVSAAEHENRRQWYEAFTAMRNDINVLIGNMDSQEANLEPGMGAECAAVVKAVADYIALSAVPAPDYSEADAVKAGEAAAFEYSKSGGGPIGVFLSGLIAYQAALASKPEGEPRPMMSDEAAEREMDRAERIFDSITSRGQSKRKALTAVMAMAYARSASL